MSKLHPGEIERDRGARVVELDIFVTASRRVEHQLGDTQVRQQVRLTERLAAGELNRQRPVAVPARRIRVQHAHAITTADAKHIGGNRHIRSEGGDPPAVPDGFDFVSVRLVRVVVRAALVGDFTHAPAHRLERVCPSVIAGTELQLIDRIPHRAGVSDGGTSRPDRVSRDCIERKHRVGGTVVDVVLQHLDAAIETLLNRRLVRPLVEATVTRLASGVLRVGGADHLRVVVPHHAISIENGRSVGRPAQQVRVLVHESKSLIAVPEQVANFTDPIAKLDVDVRQPTRIGEVIQQPALQRFVATRLASAIHVVRPSQIQIPRAGLPQARLRIAVEEVVFPVRDVVVVNALNDRLIAVVAHQVPVRPPPLLTRTRVVGLEVGQIRFVRRSIWAQIVHLAATTFHLVQVAVGQTVLFEKATILLFNRQIDAPEIAFVLGRRTRLLRFIDDAERAERAVRCWNTCEVEETKADRLEHALLAAMIEVALLDARAEVQLRPRHRILAAPVVAHLQIVASIQVELPHVLRHRVAPHPATRPIANVIKHLAVIDERATPLIEIARVSAEPRGGRHRVAPADEMKRRQAAHHVAGEGLHHAIRTRYAWLHGTRPARHAIVNKVGEVRLRIVGVRQPDGSAQ